MTTLSPERAERLKNLYLEELVRECNDKRPEARLWGGSDDWRPDTTKGVAWDDFRWVLFLLSSLVNNMSVINADSQTLSLGQGT
jgi:hypothetical protein